MHQQCVALARVASVASQSRPAQIEVGRIVDAVVCSSNSALKVMLALARPAHTMSSVTQSSSQAGNGTAFVKVFCCVRPSFPSAWHL